MSRVTTTRAARGEPARSPTDLGAAVADACDLYRLARLNLKYYGRRLHVMQRWNMGIEVAIALSTSGTVAALFGGGAGRAAVATLAATAAVLGVLKPVLNLQKRIERLSKLWAGHAGVHASLARVVRDINVYQDVDADTARALTDARERAAQLGLDDDPYPSRALLDRLQSEVDEELPPDSFWCPPTATDPSPSLAPSAAATAAGPAPKSSAGPA